ncbi:hypothetical protein [Streptomyces sp. NPDC001404]|uniref:hypothetical protein n=1 Tax=Streptomyces sp. NPDC001404 TaxID=3364571 RepID=UPI00369CFC8C
MTDQFPDALAQIREAEDAAVQARRSSEPTSYEIEFTCRSSQPGSQERAFAGFEAETPIPVPRAGDRIRLHGIPVVVRDATVNYEINPDTGGLYVGATVEVVPEADHVLSYPASGGGRVRVKVLLGIGDQVDIAADAPGVEEVQRHPADAVAQQAGARLEDLPGMQLTAGVDDQGRFHEFRRA